MLKKLQFLLKPRPAHLTKKLNKEFEFDQPVHKLRHNMWLLEDDPNTRY